MKPPVKIKLYGLIWISKRAYLITAGISYLVLLSAFGVIFYYDFTKRNDQSLFKHEMILLLLDYLHWIFGGILILVIIETVIVLHRFRKAEAQQDLDSSEY